ncbi:MAG: Rpn family recombination-promoting nuclease/putative transposase [Saprospiraceae bacterium]|nr:Rpn family recombination-promoting nuclease/putative transposase [Saprospiraceae bacterium]
MTKRKQPRQDIHQPHDKFFKEALSRLDIARDYIINFLPTNIRDKLHLGSLELSKDSYLTKELHKSFSDLVYKCTYGQGKQTISIALLFEHKSRPDRYIRLQLLRYMLNMWEAQRNNKIPLTPILPIVFYHGQQPWINSTLSLLNFA